MPEEPHNLIEFHCDLARALPQPFPAARAIPQWLKLMPATVAMGGADAATIDTVKKCAPFLDAMTCGYVLPLACEVRFFMRTATSLDFEPARPFDVIQSHPAGQYQGSPFGDRILVKFMNPWIVKTPPGYSTLFVPLLNQFTMPFQVLAGLVETDTFYRVIHFPSICTMLPGQRFVLPEGTPIVQAIPIKREAWQSKVVPRDPEIARQAFDREGANEHFYKADHWVKKDYR
jgi:hypothetical protein